MGIRRFLISNHAAQRFRDRYLTRAERDAMNIGTIGDWLDQLVVAALHEGTFEEVLDPGSDGQLREATIYQVCGRRDRDPPLYAYTRPAHEPAADGGARRQVVVTLLDAWMRDKNRRERWRSREGKLLDAPTGRQRPLRASIEDRSATAGQTQAGQPTRRKPEPS